MRKSIIPIFIPHLGCPHDCVFCNQKRISGSLLPACPQDVTRAIEEGLEKTECAQLAFYGGSFTAIPMEQQRAFLEAVQPYLAEGRISSIRLSTRPDAIDGEILAMLKEMGVSTIELGSQSMIDSVLSASWRGHTAQDTVRAAGAIKAAGFELILQMMTGLPGSSPEKDIESARHIAALRPDGVRIYPTVIVNDTALCDMWRAGEYREHSLEDAVSLCAEILPIFERADIPVIRLGLNPSDDLSGGDAVAGAYHPALGELVKGRIFLNKARAKLEGIRPQADVTIFVHPSCLSQMVGQHRCNAEALRREFDIKQLKIKSADVEYGEIRISVANERIL